VYETKRDEWYPRTWTIGAGTHLYNLKVPSRFSQCSFVGGVCTHFQRPFPHRVLSSPTFMCDSYTFPPLLTGTPPWYISVPDVNDTVPVDPYLPIT